MSADNILAVAGVSKGNLFLLIFGLGLSIPFVIFSSGLLSRLMDRYPIIILIGAAILGRVGGEMIVTDPLTLEFLRLPVTLQYCVQAICAVGVILIGKRLIRSRSRLEPEKILRYPEVKSLDPEKGDKRD
jgi:Membrane protein TerC, possibly involved in tellurium resistance